jgi:hypothetical protein
VRRHAHWVWMAACLLAAAILAGCSSKPPEITRVFARVVYAEDSVGAKSESLGVYLVANDPDGMENLSAFYVINDDAEVFWKVDSSSWVTMAAEGENWIGSSSLTLPGAALPTGQYRVVLQNAGGDTAEDSFNLPERSASKAKAVYPSATVAAGIIKVTSPYPASEVWIYGKDGKFAASFPAGGKAPPLAVGTAATASPALTAGFTYRVFAWDEQGGYGVLSRPYQSEGLPGS